MRDGWLLRAGTSLSADTITRGKSAREADSTPRKPARRALRIKALRAIRVEMKRNGFGRPHVLPPESECHAGFLLEGVIGFAL
jgi:hypothetical protein